MSLADQANDHGVCWPSIETICNRTSLSERTVQVALKELETCGLLRRSPRHKATTVWRLDAKVILQATPQQMHPSDAYPAAPALLPRRSCAFTPQQMHPDPPLEDPSLDEPLERTPARGSDQPIAAKPQATAKRAKARTQVPSDFTPNETGRAYAAACRVNAAVELPMFLNHHAAKGTLFLDWQAAWRTWCDHAVQFGRSSPIMAPVGPQPTRIDWGT